MQKKILLFTKSELPDSCANSTRVIAFAKILKECGYSVELCGITYKADGILSGEYQGLTYTNIRCPQLCGLQKLKKDRIFKSKIKDKLAELNGSIDAILLSGVYCGSMGPFLKLSRKTRVPLILNVVEWYDAKNESFSGLYGKLKFVQNRYSLRRIYVKTRNIIAISSLLGNYYKNKGCNVCVVPTVIDIDDYMELKHTPNQKLRIAYAGSPGKKDYISNAIKAILLLTDEEKSKIEMHFYGVTRDGADALGVSEEELKQLDNYVFFHGKIPQEQVKDKIAEADFTILLRPNKRFANAGFPTKVGESMACGTPVIANLTSDLDKYIIDGETGIICEDESVESCIKALRRALNLSQEEKSQMRTHTFEMAKVSFDYRNYIDTFKELLSNIFR